MASSQEFSNLLKQSKVLHLNPAQPVAITSHAGYLHRGDFGLKRPLPAASRRSPYFHVKSLDVSVSRDGQGLTDYESSAKASLFVKKWDESGLKAETKEMRGIGRYPTTLVSQFDRPSYDPVLPGTFDASASPAFVETSSPLPDIVSLTEAEFEAFLSELRAHQGEFSQHIKAELAAKQQKRPKKQTPSQQATAAVEEGAAAEPVPEVDLYTHSAQGAGSRSDLSDLITGFLTSPAGQKAYQRILAARSPGQQDQLALEGNRHHLLGLNYSADPSFDDSHLDRTIPVRLVQASEGNRLNRTGLSSARDGYTVSALGLGAAVAKNDLKGKTASRTPFSAYLDGDVSAAEPIEQQGLFEARATYRVIPSYAQRSDGSNNEQQPLWQFEPLMAQFKRDVGTAIVPELRLAVGAAARSNSYTDPKRRIGSQAWADTVPKEAEVRKGKRITKPMSAALRGLL